MQQRDDAWAEQWGANEPAADGAPTTHWPCEVRIAPVVHGSLDDRAFPTVLMVGPMPPPPLLGGIETGIELLFRTPLARASSMTLYNTWRTPDPTRSALQRLRYQLGMSWKFLATVVRTRPAIVHVKAAS